MTRRISKAQSRFRLVVSNADGVAETVQVFDRRRRLLECTGAEARALMRWGALPPGCTLAGSHGCDGHLVRELIVACALLRRGARVVGR